MNLGELINKLNEIAKTESLDTPVRIFSCEEAAETVPPAIQEPESIDWDILYLVDDIWYDKEDALDAMSYRIFETYYDGLKGNGQNIIHDRILGCETLRAIIIKGDVV